MLKIIGAGLFILCGAMLGIGRLCTLRREISVFREFDKALSLMQAELEFCARPLPELFSILSGRGEGCVSAFFESAAEKCLIMNGSESWRMCCMDESVPAAAAEAMLPLGDVLGAYDVQRQCGEIALARQNLFRESERLERRISEKERFWPLMGACAAGVVAILII